MIQLKVKILRESARLPERKTAGAAGYDVAVSWPEGKRVGRRHALPGEVVRVPIGLAFEVPPGYVLIIKGRSSADSEVVCPLSWIDSDSRGEVHLIVHNYSDRIIPLPDGLRLGQILLQRVLDTEIVRVSELSPTARGDGGFGSTGKAA